MLFGVPAHAASVGGRVVDAAGKPVKGAQVVVRPADGSAAKTVTTDGAGRFRAAVQTPADWPVQAYVVVWAPGACVGGGPVGRAPAVVRLGEARRMTGLIRDAKGSPLAGVTVRALSIIAAGSLGAPARPLTLSGTPLQARFTARSGRDGRWSIAGVPAAGRVELAMAGGDYVSVRAVEPVDREASLIMRPGGFVAGRVSLPDGRPAAGARVSAWHGATPEAAATAVAGPDGRYRLGGLPTAPTILTVAHPSSRWAAARRRVPIREQSTRTADFTLRRAVRVTVRVRDASSGRPLRQVELMSESAGSPPGGAPGGRTDAAGRRTLYAVPGSVRIWAGAAPEGYLTHGWEAFVASGGAATREAVLALHRAGNLSGVLVSTSGRGLANLEVEAHRDGARPSPPRAGEKGSAVTDPRGRFTISGLAPGRYRIKVPGFKVDSPSSLTVPPRGAIPRIRLSRSSPVG